MPRVHTIQNNRKAQKCMKCSSEIAPGEGYRHWTFRYGGKVTRCLKCPSPRPSELTQSGYLQQLYGAQEVLEDNLDNIGDDISPEDAAEAIASFLDDVKQTAEDVKSEYEDALGEWEHGNSMLEEKVETVEAWIDCLDSAEDEVRSMEPDISDDMSDEEKAEANEQVIEDMREAARNAAYELEM